VAAPDAERFTVLVVCTANRYRSPLGEFFLRAGAERAGLPWRIRSAGTHARDGRPMDPVVEQLLAEHDLYPDDWRSRRLTPTAVDEADLVLTADRSHRAVVSTLEPAARARTFLLLQFARLAAAAATPVPANGANPWEALISAAAASQAHVQPAPDGGDEVEDPIGRPVRTLRACLASIQAAADTITAAAAAIEIA
jgi:protein-tyrosine phosphatase